MIFKLCFFTFITNMLKKRRFILLLAVLGIGILLSLNYFLNEKGGNEKYLKPIVNKIQVVDNNFDQDFVEILMRNRPDEPLSFTKLTIEGSQPYYIYDEGGNIVYWSDFTWLPDFDLINPFKTYQLLEDQKGIYFTKVRRLTRNEKEFWLLQLYPLSYKRDINNEFLISGLNPELFGKGKVNFSEEKQEKFFDVENVKGEFLFSIDFEAGYEPAGQSTDVTILVFFFSLLLLVLIIGYDFISIIWRKGKFKTAIVYAALILASIRGFMIFFRFPQDYFDFELFDASKYASSWLNPSLGDLLLNVLCSLIIFSMLLGVLGGKVFHEKFKGFREKYPDWLFFLLAYVLSTVLLSLFYGLYINILSNSQWDLNIFSIPTFDYFKGISLFIIFLGGAGYLLFSILGISLILDSNSPKKTYALKLLIYFSLPVILVLSFFNWILLLVYLAHFIMLVSIVSFELYRNVFRLGLNTFLTFFFGCLIGAIITGIASYQVLLQRQHQSKIRFGTQQLVENDVMGEFFLSDAMDRIRNDIFVKNTLLDPLLSNEAIERKIRKIHLINYFDQFSQQIKVFNPAGENILDRNDPVQLQDLRFNYVKSDYATSVRDLYFIKGVDEGKGNSFFSFIPLYRDDVLLGTVYLELRQLRVQPGSVFPKLLLDSKYMANFNEKDFDYAVYGDSGLLYSVGIFNYRAEDMEGLIENPNLFDSGVNRKKYHHLGVKNQDQVVIVSSPIYSVYYILADISLFFVAFILLTLLSILCYTLAKGFGKFNFNYAAKLQMYLNFAFFFPIVTISVIIIGLLTNSYREELHRQYFQKASIIGGNLSVMLEQQSTAELGREDFVESVNILAGTTNSDINVYSPEGALIATSQPNIFDKRVLAKIINPNAIVEIVEGQNNLALLEEVVDNLTYKTVYMAIRSSDSQKILAIVSIPFFESQTELDLLIADVFSNIINIFVLIFILFLFVSYFVSRKLTLPFKLLTQKLKATNLDNNELMYWPSNDEIGLLVNEYNNMLFKLESSKKILANTEKETAWREMAKQVAHEIKNPLTPMKLTLQHLLRLQSEGKLDDPQMLKKPLGTLIQQVDTLSDIATSFSTFAKMPLPKNKLMDFREVVQASLELFQNREKEKIVFEDHTKSVSLMVMGDDQLFGRVISNLIINGIQAKERGRQTIINISLREIDNQVILEIHDNGKGIPEDLSDKIFIPNFSTKSEGSGLGLAIAKRGVETAGGKIWFETELGKGTSFFLAFDLVK
ncbi:His Kinase A (phospho-acceptor) domain-containing protein [Rhodonellum ikkaensis]|nr:His Kinase A (phospho-acceptor) domain-containing protein [Rhodonellum ikkaensis]